MATILTVHGTFAAGPEHGTQWWQIDSEFERDMRRYLAARHRGSDLQFVPVPWDGKNSEASRRAAGQHLLKGMLALEAAGETYSVIGHSHGGSVICLSLLEAVNRRQSLPGLASWITVGTPFLALQKERLLFFRLTNLGKSTLVTLATFLLLFMLSFYFDTMAGSFKPDILVLLIAPFAAVYGTMLYFNNRAYHIHRGSHWAQFDERFGPRWVPLNHHDDEAIEGLGAVGRAKFQIFDDRFAVPPLTFLGAVLVPMMLIVLLFSPSLMAGFEALVGQRNRFGGLDNVGANVEFIAYSFKNAAQAFANYVQARLDSAFAMIPHDGFRFGIEGAFSFVTFIVIPIGVILIGAYAILAAIGYIAIGVSYVLSRLLNRVAQGQIRATAFGHDMIGETAVRAGKAPFGSARRQIATLPTELALQISRFSDEEAVRSIPQIRGVLKDLALAEGGAAQPDLISKYLSGYELIHTSYFRLPRFRKLVAHVLAGNAAFEESTELKADPDYEVVRSWCRALTGVEAVPPQ